MATGTPLDTARLLLPSLWDYADRAPESALAGAVGNIRTTYELVATPEAFISTDPAGKINFVTSGTASLLGFSFDEMLGQDAVELLVPPDQLEERIATFSQVGQTGQAAEQRLWRYNKARDRVQIDATYLTYQFEPGVTANAAYLRPVHP